MVTKPRFEKEAKDTSEMACVAYLDRDLQWRIQTLMGGGGGGRGGRRAAGFDLLVLLVFLPSVISSFLSKISGGPPGPLP